MKNENVFGDVVVFKSNSLEARLITAITKNKYNHCALRTEETKAKNITRRGTLEYDLSNPTGRYDSYIILEHKEITPRRREQLYLWDKLVKNNYSTRSILTLASRHLLGMEKNYDRIIKPGKLNCSTRIALIYKMVFIPILRDIHHTQIEPNDFLDSPYFEVIKEWKR